MKTLIGLTINTLFALTTLSAGAKGTKDLWYYLKENSLGKEGTYYGYYASRLSYDETTCRTFLQTCANALALGDFDSLQNGKFGICHLSSLKAGQTETMTGIEDTYGGYYTALLFRATDGSVYAAEAYSSLSKDPIFAPEDKFADLSITNMLGRSIAVKTVRGYEGCTTCKFRLDATTVPLSVSRGSVDAPFTVHSQAAGTVLEMMQANHTLDGLAYRLGEPDDAGLCQLRFAAAPHLGLAPESTRTRSVEAPESPMVMSDSDIRFTIDNASQGFRYRVLTSTILETESFVPAPDTTVLATADGELTLSIPIGPEPVRFYRLQVLSDTP